MPGKDLIPRPVNVPATVTTPPWAQGKPETVTAWKWLHRRHHWTLPAFLLPAVWLGGLAVHAFGWTLYVCVAGLVAFGVILLIGSAKWERRPELLYATASVVLLSGWLALAGLFGPAHLWLVAAELVLVTAWGVFWWRHKRPRGQRKRQKRVAKWDAWWQSHAWTWQLAGSKVAEVHEMGVTIKVRVHGLPGRHSIQHVRQVMHLIESGLDGFADIGMVRVETVKGHANWFDFHFKRENPLAQVVEYDPAVAPMSVTENAVIGITETGSSRLASLRVNKFVIGQTRWGKSNLLSVDLAALTGCPDDRQILIDIGGGRSCRPWLGAVDYAATSLDEARQVLRMLNDEVQARRKGAYFGDEQLTPTRECPAIHLLVDETHALTSVPNGDAECARLVALIASQGNAVAVYVEIFTQHGSLEESVRTEQTRANLPFRAAFRVAEARHGAYAIPEYAKLDASRLEQKGTCYIKDGPDASPEQVRTCHMPHDLVRRIAAQPHHAALNRPPLVLYAQDWQDWWDTRWTRLDPVFADDCPQYLMLAAATPAQAYAARKQAQEDAEPPPVAPGEGDGKAAAARIAAELRETYAHLPDGALPSPVKNLGSVLALQKEHFATALQTAPPDGISPARLKDESGMSRAWIHQMLGALVEAGAVTQCGRGRYLPAHGADIVQAMAMIKDRNDDLYREARAIVSAA